MKRTIWEEIAAQGYSARNMWEALEDGAVCAMLEEKGVTQDAIEEAHELLKTSPECAPVFWTVSEEGRDYIESWLLDNHRGHRDEGELMPGQLDTYAEEALQAYENGRDAYFEIHSWDSVSGHTELCTLDDSMIVVLRYDEDRACQMEDEAEEATE